MRPFSEGYSVRYKEIFLSYGADRTKTHKLHNIHLNKT